MARAKILILWFFALALTAPAASPAQDATAGPGRIPRDSVATRRAKASAAAPVSQAWWLGTSLMILALGGAAVVCVAARKQCTGGPTVKLQVVGRVHLPPRHAVFAVKVGGRTLLIGTGPQGGPTLLGELDDEAAEAPAQAVAAVLATPAPHRPVHAQNRFDVRIGDES